MILDYTVLLSRSPQPRERGSPTCARSSLRRTPPSMGSSTTRTCGPCSTTARMPWRTPEPDARLRRAAARPRHLRRHGPGVAGHGRQSLRRPRQQHRQVRRVRHPGKAGRVGQLPHHPGRQARRSRDRAEGRQGKDILIWGNGRLTDDWPDTGSWTSTRCGSTPSSRAAARPSSVPRAPAPSNSSTAPPSPPASSSRPTGPPALSRRDRGPLRSHHGKSRYRPSPLASDN